MIAPEQILFPERKNPISGGLIKIIDDVTKIPQEIDRAEQSVNDYLTDIANRFKEGASEKTRKNLTNNKLRDLGGKAAVFANANRIKVLAGIVLIIGIIWGIKGGFK